MKLSLNLKPSLLCLFLLHSIVSQVYSQTNLKTMKMGLGSGTITTSSGGINCGTNCDGNVSLSTNITITATPQSGNSVFDHWEGNYTPSEIISESGNVLTIRKSNNNVTTVRAYFKPILRVGATTYDSIPEIEEDEINPDGIQAYLDRYPFVNTMDRFLDALPRIYKQNWILMTRSESLQTGTAKYPRILLPSEDALNVFTIGLVQHPSYPASHPNAIEYMQWDANLKTFRFHEIVLNRIDTMPYVSPRNRAVKFDDPKCFKCHSTGNVRSGVVSFNGRDTVFIGTTGIPANTRPNELVPSKAKPNWDAYDSWAGMLPFNRDRIYEGTMEETAFKKFFNIWNWRTNEGDTAVKRVIEQLILQPNTSILRRIDSTLDNQHVFIDYDSYGSRDEFITNNGSTHNFGNRNASPYSVTQGGRYIILNHTSAPNSSGTIGEGRGIRFFDFLGGLRGTEKPNQNRVADEIVTQKFATGSFPIDVRPIAFAISKGYIKLSSDKTRIIKDDGTDFNFNATFFGKRNAQNVSSSMSVIDLYNDTKARAKTLPRRKVDLQRANIDTTFPSSITNDLRIRDPYLSDRGLYRQYISNDMSNPDITFLRNEIFKRSKQIFRAADSVSREIFVDREDYIDGAQNTEVLTLYRYFLEPLGVDVDQWSMGVRARSLTYTFADVFSTYQSVLSNKIKLSLDTGGIRGIPAFNTLSNEDEVRNKTFEAIDSTLRRLPTPEAPPKYTDIQRIFNKACIACHGGLHYPPAAGDVAYASNILLHEVEFPVERYQDGIPEFIERGGIRYTPSMSPRLWQSYFYATSYAVSILRKIKNLGTNGEYHPNSLMPSGGPMLSNVDINNIDRWVNGSPVQAYTLGDPHLKTVQGISYDFQAEGEFTLLRDEFFELQARQKAVSTNHPVGPDGHTGLTSCVSINTAAAMSISGHRVTYQQSDNPKKDGGDMILRVDGKVIKLSDLPLYFSPSSRIMVLDREQKQIQVQSDNNHVVVLTPWHWTPYDVWGLKIDVRKSRAGSGLLGYINPGNWLPSMPDNSDLGPMPTSVSERFNMLYKVFGNAWRVTDQTSMFDYATGTGTLNFTNKEYPESNSQICKIDGREITVAIEQAEAERLCSEIKDPERRRLCMLDLMAMGERNLADAYIASEKAALNENPEEAILVSPKYSEEVLFKDLVFVWKRVNDKDGDDVEYRLLVWDPNEFPDNNKAIRLSKFRLFLGYFNTNCLWYAFLVFLILLFLLVVLLRKRSPKLFRIFLLLLLLLFVGFVWFFCKKDSSQIRFDPGNLEKKKTYLWKVITEDGRGGFTESETRRVVIRE